MSGTQSYKNSPTELYCCMCIFDMHKFNRPKKKNIKIAIILLQFVFHYYNVNNLQQSFQSRGGVSLGGIQMKVGKNTKPTNDAVRFFSLSFVVENKIFLTETQCNLPLHISQDKQQPHLTSSKNKTK